MDPRCQYPSLIYCFEDAEHDCHIPCEAFMQYCYSKDPSELDWYGEMRELSLSTDMRRLRAGALDHCVGCLLILDAITTASKTDLQSHDFFVNASLCFKGSEIHFKVSYRPDYRRRVDDAVFLEVFAVKGG